MSYNLEKYRQKREKVLGVRKRGLSFAAVAALVAGVIIIGLGGMALPQISEYLTTRNLDDVIYKRSDAGAWPPEMVKEIAAQAGVSQALVDHNQTRLVVTFNRNATDPGQLEALLNRQGIKAELLNRIDHRQRLTILSKEGKRATP